MCAHVPYVFKLLFFSYKIHFEMGTHLAYSRIQYILDLFIVRGKLVNLSLKMQQYNSTFQCLYSTVSILVFWADCANIGFFLKIF